MNTATGLVIALSAWLCTAAVQAAAQGGPAELYVDAGPDGNDVNPGSAALPKKTLQAASQFLSANPVGSTVYLAGTFRGQTVFGQALSNCKMLGWPGRPRPLIRADVVMSDWVASGSDWEVDVGANTEVTSVTEDWDIRVLPDGRHYGHLRGHNPQGSPNFGNGQWTRVGTNLRIRTSDGSDPNTNGRVYTVVKFAAANGHPVNGIALDADDTIVQGIDTALYTQRHHLAAPEDWAGENIVFQNSQRCTIEDCDSWDGGLHCFGFLNGSTDCVIRNCNVYGSRSNFGVSIVDMESTTFNLRGEVTDTYFACSGLLDYAGNVLNAMADENDVINGFFAQVDVPHTIDSLVIRNCTFEQFENSPLSASAAIGSRTNVPADDKDPETYPVRFYDCVFRNSVNVLGIGDSGHIGSWVACIRCRFECTRYETAIPAFGFGGLFEFHATTTGSGLFLDACVWVIDQNPLGMTGIVARNNSKVRLRNSLMWALDAVPTGNAQVWLHCIEPTSDFWARGCVFGYAAPGFAERLIDNDASIPVANRDFEDCWYYNISNNSYSQNPAINTEAEWAATVDLPGVYDLNPQLANPPADMEGVAGGSIRTMVNALADHTPWGINQKPYDGHYGAYQYGNSGGDIDGDGAVDIVDFLALLAAWGPCPAPPVACPADLDGDGSVGILDMLTLLSNWTV